MDRTIGTWICTDCKKEMKSFLYNSSYHVPSDCSCGKGQMIEDESLREKPSGVAIVRGKQGEDAWMATQSPSRQADILLGRDPEY